MPPLSPADIKRLKALAARPDSEIDYSDIPPLTDAQLDRMVLVPAVASNGSRNWLDRVEDVKRARKQAISFRLDRPVLDWFRKQGPRYQSRMNAVLKAYMEAHRV